MWVLVLSWVLCMVLGGFFGVVCVVVVAVVHCARRVSCMAAICHIPPNWLFAHWTMMASGVTMVRSMASWLAWWQTPVSGVSSWPDATSRKSWMYFVFVASAALVILL